MNTVLIFPEPGNTKAISKQLLALADKALDVEFVSWPQEGFRVPEELALKFEASFTKVAEAGEPSGGSVAVADIIREEIEAPVRRKPGRPKKEAQ